jgi:hypothetical protein
LVIGEENIFAGASVLAMESRAMRFTRTYALSLATIASKFAPTEGHSGCVSRLFSVFQRFSTAGRKAAAHFRAILWMACTNYKKNHLFVTVAQYRSQGWPHPNMDLPEMPYAR